MPRHPHRGRPITAAQLAAILRLRAEVFVVEQGIVYNDLLPAIDTLPTTTHYVVFDDHGAAIGYLRTYPHDGARKVGRVVTAGSVRGTGLGKLLMDALVAEESGPLVMSAQAYLEDYYAHWGFVRVGDPYLEEEIDHVWMERRRAGAYSRACPQGGAAPGVALFDGTIQDLAAARLVGQECTVDAGGETVQALVDEVRNFGVEVDLSVDARVGECSVAPEMNVVMAGEGRGEPVEREAKPSAVGTEVLNFVV